jgi:hypothetical protein
MRPQQQNRRMRGRNNNNNNNNNNRKGPNPLTRNYESNGPDVKIRGSAQQIAEKYATLARDAQSAGDRVMAENYLQHAEHYNRIIAAAQAQMPQPQMREGNRDDLDDDDEERFDQDGGMPEGNRRDSQEIRTQQRLDDGSGPQPVIEGTPAEVALNQDAPGERNGNERNGNEHHANGGHNGQQQAADGEDDGEDGRARRARRPRRRRPDYANGEGANGEGANGGSHAANADAPETPADAVAGEAAGPASVTQN